MSRAGLSKIYLHSQRHDGPHNTFTEPENAISAEKNVPKVYLSYADLAKIWKVGKQLLVLDYVSGVFVTLAVESSNPNRDIFISHILTFCIAT